MLVDVVASLTGVRATSPPLARGAPGLVFPSARRRRSPPALRGARDGVWVVARPPSTLPRTSSHLASANSTRSCAITLIAWTRPKRPLTEVRTSSSSACSRMRRSLLLIRLLRSRNFWRVSVWHPMTENMARRRAEMLDRRAQQHRAKPVDPAAPTKAACRTRRSGQSEMQAGRASSSAGREALQNEARCAPQSLGCQ